MSKRNARGQMGFKQGRLGRWKEHRGVEWFSGCAATDNGKVKLILK